MTLIGPVTLWEFINLKSQRSSCLAELLYVGISSAHITAFGAHGLCRIQQGKKTKQKHFHFCCPERRANPAHIYFPTGVGQIQSDGY